MPVSYTRPQLEQMLNSGQSVIINGKHIQSLAELPSEAELAIGDRERTQAALAAHDQQIASLLAERKKLQDQLAATPEPTAPAPVRQPAAAGDQPAQPPPGCPPGGPPEVQAEARADAPKPPDRPKAPEPGKAAGPELSAPQADAPPPPRPGQPLFTPPPPRAPTPPDEGEGDDRGQRARGRRGV